MSRLQDQNLLEKSPKNTEMSHPNSALGGRTSTSSSWDFGGFYGAAITLASTNLLRSPKPNHQKPPGDWMFSTLLLFSFENRLKQVASTCTASRVFLPSSSPDSRAWWRKELPAESLQNLNLNEVYNYSVQSTWKSLWSDSLNPRLPKRFWKCFAWA